MATSFISGNVERGVSVECRDQIFYSAARCRLEKHSVECLGGGQ